MTSGKLPKWGGRGLDLNPRIRLAKVPVEALTFFTRLCLCILQVVGRLRQGKWLACRNAFISTTDHSDFNEKRGITIHPMPDGVESGPFIPLEIGLGYNHSGLAMERLSLGCKYRFKKGEFIFKIHLCFGS